MRPITYYVHGALSTHRSFSFIKQQLLQEEICDRNLQFADAAELKKIMPREERDFSYDIRVEQGQEMVDRLTKSLSSLGKRTVTLVCHSFGGILGVAAARNVLKANPDMKVNIITMGSPLGGSAMASFLKMLKPSSTFFDNIGSYGKFMREFMSHALPCRTRAIVTTEGHADWMSEPNDGVVTVASQMYYDGDPLFFPTQVKLNHFEVLMSDKSVSTIKKELAT